ncbi:fasciclin domain-containing protein [Spirosoma rhododendri]|uniref:Fasciclin domain-containing protein n=1 Tax=Spirosoma rhododendri TaxID=2728024 RepID=A0A7L5DJR1_9BACT|nr:fasciclin domain-containing protein [Spirosoma rhododendri]QJD77682.1 fasciclin domain-containing protein [Spirosoma rhododendri]
MNTQHLRAAVLLFSLAITSATLTHAQSTLKASGVATGKTMLASAQGQADYTTVLKLLTASGLDKQANAAGQYTVFAPNNGAFDELGDATLQELLLPSSKSRLAKMLAYHVVKGRYTSDKLRDGQTLTNLTGQILVVHKQGDNITITDGRGTVADVIQRDVRATNGVIYTINKVLEKNLPQADIR